MSVCGFSSYIDEEMTVPTNAFAVSVTILMYYENVVFSISRVRALRWQSSGWAGSHGEERGERYGDYRQERRAQRGQGHQESCAHDGLHLHAIGEFRRVVTSAAFLPLSYGCRQDQERLDETPFRTQSVGNCRIGFRFFIFCGK